MNSICYKSSVKISENIAITNTSKTWKHIVSKKDGAILFKEGTNRFIFNIAPKKSVEQRTLYFNNAENGIYKVSECSYSFHSLVVPDEYTCKTLPFYGYHNIIPKNRSNLIYPKNKEEVKAIETLRESLTEKEFQKFIKYGFISVKATSGRIYQIFQNKKHIHVWKNGNKIEEICLYLKDNKIPPTDKLIAFKTMIETSEDAFIKLGNVYKLKK